MSMTLAQLAERLGTEVVGDGSRVVTGCAGIHEADEHQITFLANPKYVRYLDTTSKTAATTTAAHPMVHRVKTSSPRR